MCCGCRWIRPDFRKLRRFALFGDGGRGVVRPERARCWPEHARMPAHACRPHYRAHRGDGDRVCQWLVTRPVPDPPVRPRCGNSWRWRAACGGCKRRCRIHTRGESAYLRATGARATRLLQPRLPPHPNRRIASLLMLLRYGLRRMISCSKRRPRCLPPDEGTVFVTGNVAQPGYVPYAGPERPVLYDRRDKAPIRAACTCSNRIRRDTHGSNPVVSGTTIFVDRRP